jgi:phenylacetate-CoA ligase
MHRARRSHPLRPWLRREAARLGRADASVIRDFQDRRLRRLVRWAAASSPFYRSWFAESGVDPRSVRSVDDLALLPLLDRNHLVENARQFCAYPAPIVWKASSSGTSGSVVTAYRTAGSSVYELTVLERQWSWFGLPRGARRVILRGSDFHADTPGTVVREIPGANQLLVSSFQLTPENLPQITAAIRAFAPVVIEGWPSSITLLAGLLQREGQRLRMRAVITSSEVISTYQRDLMADVFAPTIIDHYGQTERVAMAGTCPSGGYHAFSDYGILELLPAGEDSWEIVGTPLHNWGFPLFRYRTGDTVGPAADGPCACGLPFPLVGTIDGRVEEAFTASDGRPIPLPHALVKNLVGLREVQAVQRAPGHFEIRFVPGVGFDPQRMRALARRNVDRLVGPGQTVVFRETDRIARTAHGKVRTTVVLDDLAPGVHRIPAAREPADDRVPPAPAAAPRGGGTAGPARRVRPPSP